MIGKINIDRRRIFRRTTVTLAATQVAFGSLVNANTKDATPESVPIGSDCRLSLPRSSRRVERGKYAQFGPAKGAAVVLLHA